MNTLNSTANMDAFSVLLACLDDAIMIIDLQGQVLYANQTLLDLFAIQKHETTVGFNILSDLCSGAEARQAMQEHLKQLAEEGDAKFEWHSKKMDGSPLNVEVHLSRIPLSPERNACFVQMRDRASFNNVENALRESEAKFRFMAENSADIIWHMDSSYRFTYISPADEKLRGFKVEEVLGTTVFSLLKPEGIEHVKAVNAKRLEDEKAGIKTDVIRYELEQICKDGSYIWTEINVNPYRDANGTFIGYYGVTRDISERKRAETAIDDLNRELDLRLKERTAQLELVSQELASTSYSMAHTLRTPLRALDGFSYILLEEYENVLDAQGQDYLKRIRAASHRMGLLTDNLIRLLAITRSDLAMTEVNLSRLAQNYIKVLSTSQPERKVNFDCADDMVVQGDPYLMSVLIENLLDNAWKFTRECATAHITLGQYMQEGKPVFFVEDNGVGFDMAYVKKLFGNFQRLHAPDAYEGTGIGLAIVKRIILRHGGRIWAESKVNQGSTFYFTIG